MAAIPFPPERVLELGMGTGETTRRLIEAHPDAWVIGLDASPDMVFRARQTYDDVQLARMEDPLPDGPWDLVISVLSVSDLDDEQQQNLFRRVKDHSRSLVIGDVFEADELEKLVEWCDGEVTWQPTAWRSPRRESEVACACRAISAAVALQLSSEGCPTRPRYHPATDGRPEEENLQRPPRQAARQPQGRQGRASTAARAATARACRIGSARPAAPTPGVR